jgi:hypothetical protein
MFFFFFFVSGPVWDASLKDIRQFHNEHTQLQAQWQRKTIQSSLPKSCADCVLLFDDARKNFPMSVGMATKKKTNLVPNLLIKKLVQLQFNNGNGLAF